MEISYELGKSALWSGAAIGLVALAAFGFLLGGQWFRASTASKLAGDGYVIGYFQGPGKDAPCTTEENKYPHVRPC